MSTAFLLALLSASVFAAPAPIPQADTNSSDSTAAAQASALTTANAIGAQAGAFPNVGQNVSALGDSLTTYETTLGTSLNVAVTENARGGCADMTVVFARGTTEPGNVGLLAGPPFFDALKAMVGAGNVDVQGVEYAADIPGFLIGGSPQGSQTM
jgi:hypothetical protein